MAISRSLEYIKLGTKVTISSSLHWHLANKRKVPSYQPEISYNIFMRSLFNRDIALGMVDISDDYITSGPSDTWHIKNIPPVMPEPVCYVLKPDSCTEEQWAMVLNETAVVNNYLVVDRISDDEHETLRGKHDDAQQRLGDYEEL